MLCYTTISIYTSIVHIYCINMNIWKSIINIYSSISTKYLSNTGIYSFNTNIGRIIVSTLNSMTNIESINTGIYTFNIVTEKHKVIIIWLHHSHSDNQNNDIISIICFSATFIKMDAILNTFSKNFCRMKFWVNLFFQTTVQYYKE